MKLPPKPLTMYPLPTDQDRRIFQKLSLFQGKQMTPADQSLVELFYSQLEENWRDPLESTIDQMLKRLRLEG
jgi:hypothetical protein